MITVRFYVFIIFFLRKNNSDDSMVITPENYDIYNYFNIYIYYLLLHLLIISWIKLPDCNLIPKNEIKINK